MKKVIRLTESELIRTIKLIVEEEENSQASDISKVQNLVNLEGGKVDVKGLLNKKNPICEPPITGNQENDTIIKKVWDWAHDPSNRNDLKTTLKNLKDAIFKSKKEQKTVEVNEQVGVGIVIGGITLGPSVLIAIGAVLVIILIIALIPKKSSCQKRSKQNFWGN
jgi:hypothetical protein